MPALQLSTGDIVYLAVVSKAAQEPSYQYGLQLLGHTAPARSPETAIQVALRLCTPHICRFACLAYASRIVIEQLQLMVWSIGTPCRLQCWWHNH